MEGGLLIHAAYALSLVFVWVYRRWFEKVAPRSEEFEAFCASRPALFALALTPGSEGAALAALGELLPAGETVATLGPFPWIHHALSVTAEQRSGMVCVGIAGCRVLRTREKRVVALGDVVSALALRLGEDLLDTWIDSRACIDVSGRTAAEHGWRLRDDASKRRPFVARGAEPAWLSSGLDPTCRGTREMAGQHRFD